jgi:hypothetical protein
MLHYVCIYDQLIGHYTWFLVHVTRSPRVQNGTAVHLLAIGLFGTAQRPPCMSRGRSRPPWTARLCEHWFSHFLQERLVAIIARDKLGISQQELGSCAAWKTCMPDPLKPCKLSHHASASQSHRDHKIGASLLACHLVKLLSGIGALEPKAVRRNQYSHTCTLGLHG